MEIDSISSRLAALIEHFGLTASAFADKMGVQRSGVSHLISGRNKPSLDFIVKVLDTFPEVDLYWLLIGKGEILKAEDSFTHNAAANDEVKEQPRTSSHQTEVVSNPQVISKSEKIILLHHDGTFSEYNPKG